MKKTGKHVVFNFDFENVSGQHFMLHLKTIQICKWKLNKPKVTFHDM